MGVSQERRARPTGVASGGGGTAARVAPTGPVGALYTGVDRGGPVQMVKKRFIYKALLHHLGTRSRHIQVAVPSGCLSVFRRLTHLRDFGETGRQIVRFTKTAHFVNHAQCVVRYHALRAEPAHFV